MDKEKFCYVGEGWLATTHIDSHGHKLTIRGLKQMARDLKENPSRRVLNINHDPNNKIGEVIKWKVMKKDENHDGIYITYGIYKGRGDVLEQIKNRELKGFSYTAIELGGRNSDEDFDKLGVKIGLDGKDIIQVEKALKSQRITPMIRLNKSADVLCYVGFDIFTLAALLTVLKILYDFYKDGKIGNQQVTFKNCTFNFNNKSFEEISEKVKKEWESHPTRS